MLCLKQLKYKVYGIPRYNISGIQVVSTDSDSMEHFLNMGCVSAFSILSLTVYFAKMPSGGIILFQGIVF